MPLLPSVVVSLFLATSTQLTIATVSVLESLLEVLPPVPSCDGKWLVDSIHCLTRVEEEGEGMNRDRMMRY